LLTGEGIEMSSTDNTIRPDVRAFLDMLEALQQPQIHELPLADARAAAGKMAEMADIPPLDLAVIRDLACPGPAGEIPLRLYDAKDSRDPGPVIVFFHGGGFVIGDLESYHSLCTEIAARTGLPVVSVDYRLAPENPFPAAPDDCEAAARWIAASPAELGLEVTGLITMGDSAGGNLTIVTTLALLDDPAQVPVIMQVPVYPIASAIEDHDSMRDFGDGLFLTREVMGWFTRSYAPDPESPRNYPLLRTDHSRTPPTVLLTAGLDPLRDSGREYGARLAASGVELTSIEAEGMIHGFVQMRRALPSTAADMNALFEAIERVLEHRS
jgi:acetyl esterase